MEQSDPGAICIDCARHDEIAAGGSDVTIPLRHFCEHWRPEYWETCGYFRDRGDAAVMNGPHV